jgi:magnesium transporter
MYAAAAVPADESLISGFCVSVPTAGPDEIVSDVVNRLQGESGAPRHWIAVCHEGRLRGIVAAAELLIASPGSSLASLARPPLTVVHADTGAERVAWLAAHSGAEVIAVQDSDGDFKGLVPAVSLLPLLVREHEMDLARLGGFLSGTRRARTASEEPVARRVLHRAPWLLLGLIGAVLAARIVSSFEAELEQTVALAFFLPGIVYMADAVGTQTETLVIRGLSVGVAVPRIFRLEVLTGIVVGVLLSVAIFPMALLVTGETDLSFAIAASLLASTACATLVAMTLPWAMSQFSLDPAFGSGPLATVVQDLLSILIYFGIALAVVE